MNNKGTNSSDTRVRMKTGTAKNASAQGSIGCSSGTLTGRGSSLLVETNVSAVGVLEVEMRGPYNSPFVYHPMRNQTKITDNLSMRNQTLLILLFN